jgi:hypothetical protein
MTMGSRTCKLVRVLAAVLFGVLAYSVIAQNVAGQSFEPGASPVTMTDPDSDTASEDELGQLVLLETPSKRRLFKLSSSTQYLYTSNVSLVQDLGLPFPFEKESDALFFQTFDLSFSPQLLDKLGSTIFVRHQILRYDKHSGFDFDTDAAGLSLGYPVGEWFTAYGGFSASRMYARDTEHEFFKTYDTQFGLWRQHAISRQAALFFGYQLDWRASSPSAFDRIDNAGYVGLNLSPNEKVAIQFVYRLRVQDYDKFFGTDRADVDHLLGFALTYTFNQYVSARVFGNYADNNSNVAGRDYSVLDLGGGLNLSVKF